MVLFSSSLGFLAQGHFLAHFLRNIALDLVEAISEDANDGRLRYEGVGVHILDEAEDILALALAGQDEEHLGRRVGEPAVAVEDRHAVVGGAANGAGYLLIVFGEDQELHALSSRVEYIVEHDVLRQQREEAEDHRVETLLHRCAKG